MTIWKEKNLTQEQLGAKLCPARANNFKLCK